MTAPLTTIIPVGTSPAGRDRDYLSFSAIRTYQACPLKYYFKYVAGVPEESVAASLLFGTAIHRAIEHHYRKLLAGHPPPGLEPLIAEYTAAWENGHSAPVHFGKEESRPVLDRLAHQMLRVFASSAVAQPGGRILAVEEQLRGPIVPGLPDLVARVDLILETETELIISDWKTSRARWNAEQLEQATEQLLLYAELARNMAPGKTVRLEFVVLSKTKETIIDRHLAAVDPTRVTRTKRVVERVWRAVEGEHFFPAPGPLNCSGCPYRRTCRSWPL